MLRRASKDGPRVLASILRGSLRSRLRMTAECVAPFAHTPVWLMNLVLKYPSIASVPPSEP
jgi:hypothetical protein